MDWFSRYVLAWRLSNTLEVDFCLEALNEALSFGKPEIFNTDQGSQFTSPRFTGTLGAEDIRISMDGRGRALDNIFIERLWRSVKYEDLYIKDYETVPTLHTGLSDYFLFYNLERLTRVSTTSRPLTSTMERRCLSNTKTQSTLNPPQIGLDFGATLSRVLKFSTPGSSWIIRRR